MPEIPEIETVRRQLELHIVGKAVQQINILRPKTMNVSPAVFIEAVQNQSITAVQRRAKLLVLALSNHKAIVFHFMLEGYVHFYAADETVARQSNLLLIFTTGEVLAFYKMQLGFIHLSFTDRLEEIAELDGLGPEPLAEEFTFEKFLSCLHGRKGRIKPLLMDQHVIAGIGNVYSNEILFCSQILPTRKTSGLTEPEKRNLYACMRNILARSIDAGGVNDALFSAQDTSTGNFTPQLQVAYRTGKPCLVCGHSIETQRVAGRNAFFCPVCQK
jgi:formamidopyrimidine-DNA glycosylase